MLNDPQQDSSAMYSKDIGKKEKSWQETEKERLQEERTGWILYVS
jgi:hypothetical protein